ncbi:MAG: oligosaccharide flippase family protein [Pelistega sp.]|nr:oligosaccharide flippase family protein [Pelistega sp.]
MRILKDSFIYMFGELLSKSLPFLMLPYLTRKLGPEGFGELSLYLVWLSLLGILIGLSQEGAISRYYYFYGKRFLKGVYLSGYLYSSVVSSVLLVISWICNSEIMAYLIITSMFASMLNVQLSLRQCQKEAKKYVSIQLLYSFFTVVFTVIVLEYIAYDLVEGRVVSILFANLVAFSLSYALAAKSSLQIQGIGLTPLKLKLSLTYVLSFGMPLVFHHLSIFAKGQLDRLFIYDVYSASELGVYSAAVQIAAVVPVVLMALNKAVVPYYYESLKNNKITLAKIKKITLLSLPLVFIPVIVAYLLPQALYTLILGSGYEEAKYFTVLYVLGFMLNLPYFIIVNYYFYIGKTAQISKNNIISAVIYIIILYVTLGFGIEYVPFALIFSNLFLILILVKVAR